MQYLYNITFNPADNRTSLTPYVPYSAAPDEDREIPRICFSDSIAHCIEAVGSSSRDLRTGGVIYARCVALDSLDIDWLVPPETLYAKGLVPDALETMEHWYLRSTDVIREAYRILDFSCEFDIAWTCIKRDDLSDIVNSYGHVPDGLERFMDAKSLYNHCVRYYDRHGMYDLEDAIYDDVASLPWAQRLRINSLKLEQLPLRTVSE